MAWVEKPPMRTGNLRDDLNRIWDYLFRLSQLLENIDPNSGSQNSVKIEYAKDGTQLLSPVEGGGVNSAELENDLKNLRAQLLQSINTLTQTMAQGDAESRNYTDERFLEAWPVNSIAATTDPNGPAADLGGTWALLSTGTIGTETVYYYQKTGNGGT